MCNVNLEVIIIRLVCMLEMDSRFHFEEDSSLCYFYVVI